MLRAIQTQKLFYDTLMESQYWPEEKLHEVQRQQLERLLRHARDHSPFYRDRLDVIFANRGTIDWSRWNEIPILMRQDLADHGAEMVSEALPAGHGETNRSTTSGSTGIPVTAVSSAYANMASKVAGYRGQHWHRADWSKDILFYMEETPAGAWPNVEIGPPWGPTWAPEPTGRFLRLNGDTAPRNVIEFIARHDEVRYLSCRAKVAQVLALEFMRLGLPAELDAVFAFSTATYDDEREDLRRAFGARVLSFYASKEAGLMAYQCPIHNHLHLSEELVLLELLDDHDRPVPKGTAGHVVVTNMLNWAQPLIRYRHGDLAVEGDPCSCGRTLRVLDNIVGRVSNMFRFPDGRAVAFGVPKDFKSSFNIKTWQIAQVTPLELEVRYATISEDQRLDEHALGEVLRSMIHPDVMIRFKRSDAFVPRDGRKFAEYVNELPNGRG